MNHYCIFINPKGNSMSIIKTLKNQAINNPEYKKCMLINKKIKELSFVSFGVVWVFISIFLIKSFEYIFENNLNANIILFIFLLIVLITGFLYITTYRPNKILKKTNLNKEKLNKTLSFENVYLTEKGFNMLKKELNPDNDGNIEYILNCYKEKTNSLKDMIILENNIKRYKIIEEAFKDLDKDNHAVKRVPYSMRFVHYFNLNKSDLDILKYNSQYKDKVDKFIKNREALNIVKLYEYIKGN